MKRYKSIKIEFVDNKISGYSPSSEKPDMETIFPWFQPPEELFDKYGNYCNEVDVTVKEVDGEHGSETITECKYIYAPMQPTPEQQEAYRKKRIVEEMRKSYSVDDEVALIKDTINAIINKEEISSDYFKMEVDRDLVKDSIDKEIRNELDKGRS